MVLSLDLLFKIIICSYFLCTCSIALIDLFGRYASMELAVV